MTRAKEKLYIISNNCESERQISYFIHDFESKDYENSNFTKKEVERQKVHYKRWIKSLLVKKKGEINSAKNLEDKISYIVNGSSKELVEAKQEVSAVKERITTSKASADNEDLIEKIVKPFLINNKLIVIDKRDKGGALWVIGGQELSQIMKKLEIGGIKFKFVANGGKSTKHKAAWFYSCK